ncbi:PAS domain-containing sensor histidine kinase [Geomonas azotofigens]|uniref:PAS domain-containing sensor histidine kinase n=1 Tax=Geomonas azotofigens TaxID=2843196 RepID=UPI001C11E16E|nr:ATP-binding protein [Geomonas azotofigens]MBU5612404.1 PAS domain-containing sensor histidine kinase [Geomonas azotofigens]
MDVTRRMARWAKLSEPGLISFLFQILLGALLVLVFWVVDGLLDYLLFGGRPLADFLLASDSHEDFALVLFLVCGLLLYSRRAHRNEAALEQALQAALEEAERERAKMEGIFEALGEAVSIQDPDLKVLYQNPAHQRMTGPYVGRYCYEAYRKESVPCAGCHLLASFQDGKVHRAELGPEVSATGGYVELIGSSLKGSDGKPHYGIEIVRDITARKLAEEETAALNAALTHQAAELQQANQELEAFCHAISHDMRAPLTRVYSSAQELRGYRGQLDDNGRFFVDLVHDGCIQMEALLDSLMVLCRVTEVELACATFDLVPVACEIAAQLRQDQPGHHVSFLTPERLMVHGDPQLLRVVLENLLSNAWKYSNKVEAPVVELGSVATGQGEGTFFIRDNGAGFDSARAGQLFQPFKRLHTYRDFPGTGLGLATVRRIVRRHNGRVWGEGVPGRGATFYVMLPG